MHIQTSESLRSTQQELSVSAFSVDVRLLSSNPTLTRLLDGVKARWSVGWQPQTYPWKMHDACIGELRAATTSSGHTSADAIDGGSGRARWRLEVKISSSSALKPGQVRFTDHPQVPALFRGRRLSVMLPAESSALVPSADEQVLAETREGPVWVTRTVCGQHQARSAYALPPVELGLCDVFHARRFMEVLPLLHLVRQIEDLADWHDAPLRAAYVIDDPNLHWRSYGRIDYREALLHAKREQYHLAFATIPLDSWGTHEATATLFRQHPAELSLLVHGNDHLSNELAQVLERRERLALLRQASVRIERLHRASGVPVSKVMVPPHGACSVQMLADLPYTGFEAACVSTGSLHAHNPQHDFGPAMGLNVSENVLGCPALPRWAINADAENAALIAAYLGQAMVIRGHQEDFREGYERWDAIARFINAFGPVQWAALDKLSRLSYRWQNQGELCLVQPHARRVNFIPPKSSTALTVDAAAGGTWLVHQGIEEPNRLPAGAVLPLTKAAPGTPILLERIAPLDSLTDIPLPPFRARPLLRRLLTEARDRVLR